MTQTRKTHTLEEELEHREEQVAHYETNTQAAYALYQLNLRKAKLARARLRYFKRLHPDVKPSKKNNS